MKKKIVIKPAYELNDIVYFIRREVERKNGFRAVTYRIMQTKIAEIITYSSIAPSFEGVIPKKLKVVTETYYKLKQFGEGTMFRVHELYKTYEDAKRVLDKLEDSKMFIEEVKE